MFAEFKHTLRRLRGSILGWGIGLAAYTLLIAAFYGSLSRMDEGLTQLINSYPKELMAFFGDFARINTPAGYLHTYFFLYMTLIIGIFSVGAGANLLAKDEESGTLDLVLAHPVSRTGLWWGRFLGLGAATAAMLLIAWLGWVLPSSRTGLHLTWLQFLLPFLPLWAVLMLFSALAALLSMLMPSASTASMSAGTLLAANWLLEGMVGINKDLKAAYRWTPLYFFQGGDAIDGIQWSWLAMLLGVTLLLSLLAWWLFQRRDIRVGGERSWSLTLR